MRFLPREHVTSGEPACLPNGNAPQRLRVIRVPPAPQSDDVFTAVLRGQAADRRRGADGLRLLRSLCIIPRRTQLLCYGFQSEPHLKKITSNKVFDI